MNQRFRSCVIALLVLILPGALFAQVRGDAFPPEGTESNAFPETVQIIGARIGEDIVVQFSPPQTETYYRIVTIDTNLLEFKEFARDGARARYQFVPKTPGATTLIIEELAETLTRVYRYEIAIAAEEKKQEETKSRASRRTNAQAARSSEDMKRYQVAMDLFNGKLYTPAEEAFNEVVLNYRLSEYAGRSLARLGDIAFSQSNYAEAVTRYGAVTNSVSAPEDETIHALIGIGRAYIMLKENDTAVKPLLFVSQSFSANPKAGNALYYAAVAYNNLNRKKEAANVLERALENYKVFDLRGDALYLLGGVYDSGGKEARDIPKAHGYYKQYLKEFPKGALAKAAKDRIEYLEKNYLNVR